MHKVNTPETSIQIKKQLCQLPPKALHLRYPTTFLPLLKETTVLKGKSWLNIRNRFLTIRATELPHRLAVALNHGNSEKQFYLCQKYMAC